MGIKRQKSALQKVNFTRIKLFDNFECQKEFSKDLKKKSLTTTEKFGRSCASLEEVVPTY